jgi:competence protein ComEC
LWRHVGHQRAGLAAAVLLGAREQLDEDRTEDFFATGSIHLLAISGLHVGILVYFFWLAARTTLLTRRAALVAAAVFVVLYALLTDARPPVVRAAVLIVVLCTARLLWRQTLAFNSLAAAGIFVLMLNPAQSFQVGTQLSFLAVATLACCGHWLGPRAPQDPLDRLIAHSRPWPVRSAKRFGSVVWRLCLTSTVIWLVALPLIMYRFNLLSPVAVVLNPVLWLPTAIALFSGFGVLIFGWLMPPLAAACGWLCSVSLASIEICTRAARHLPGSHFFGPAPALWWVAAFYAALGLLVAFPELRPPRRWCVALICAWIAIGLATSNMMRPRQSDEQPLDCTFLAVGHGTSVVVELPGRKTLLYDSGCFSSPAGAARSITACLWSRGITHIDAIVISHADADHYNALPELLERVSVGVVYVSPVMFQESSPALAWLRAAIEDAGVPIRELAAGDRLQASHDVQMEVLHPLPRGVAGSDNANSIVLEINYCGKRILLPGDLETPGLEDVLDEEPRDCDCVMAPHHGSLRSNPRGFAAWSTPEWVVISGGYERDLDKVIAAYQTSAASVLHTARDGAVRVTLDREQIRVQSWRNDQWR